MTFKQSTCPACGDTRNVLRIEDTPDGRRIFFECGHSDYVVVKSENVTLSENVDELIIKDPINEIQSAINDRDYFKPITYACTIVEHYGKQILFWYFRSNGTPVSKEKIDRMELTSIILMLYTHKIINDSIKIKIFEVKDVRNDFIHEGASIKLTPERRKEFDATTKHALTCVKFIKAKYDEELKKQQPNND